MHVTLRACELMDLRIGERVETLTIENHSFLRMDKPLAWPKLKVLRFRHIDTLFDLNSQTFGQLKSLRTLSFENIGNSISIGEGTFSSFTDLDELAFIGTTLHSFDEGSVFAHGLDLFRIVGCTLILNNAYLVSVNASTAVVENCRFEYMASDSLRLTADEVVINNNVFVEVEKSGVLLAATRFNINNNVFMKGATSLLASLVFRGSERDLRFHIANNTWMFLEEWNLDIDFGSMRNYSPDRIKDSFRIFNNSLPCSCLFPNNVVGGNKYIGQASYRAAYYKQFSAARGGSWCWPDNSQSLREFLLENCAASVPTKSMTKAIAATTPSLVSEEIDLSSTEYSNTVSTPIPPFLLESQEGVPLSTKYSVTWPRNNGKGVNEDETDVARRAKLPSDEVLNTKQVEPPTLHLIAPVTTAVVAVVVMVVAVALALRRMPTTRRPARNAVVA